MALMRKRGALTEIPSMVSMILVEHESAEL
jgi:hypothetical protein